MGMPALVGQWLWSLKERGALDGCRSVFEFGPQSMLNPIPFRRFVHSRFRDREAIAAFERDAFAADGNFVPDAQRAYYRLLGLDDYNAVDLEDPAANYKANLNLPLKIDRRFDVSTNFGTAEHIFNIGQCFADAHRLVRPGGVMLYCLPTLGAWFHGFYSVHSVVYRSLAAANDYEILDLMYANDIVSAGENFDRTMRWPRLDDIRAREPRLQATRFFTSYFYSIAARTARPAAYIFAAFRKKSDRPFAYPNQINNDYGKLPTVTAGP